MSNMIGNPHFADHLCDHVDSNDGRAISAATLALAYEQRTANLIAIWTAPDRSRLDAVHYGELKGTIAARLGLDHP